MIYTVFFRNETEAPQDFGTYKEAEDYAKERNAGEYTIESTSGEVV